MGNFVQRLDDTSLELVSGGIDGIVRTAAGVIVTSVPVSFGCSVASAVCQYKAKAYKKQGDAVKAQELETAGRVLTDVAVSVGACGVTGIGALYLATS